MNAPNGAVLRYSHVLDAMALYDTATDTWYFELEWDGAHSIVLGKSMNSPDPEEWADPFDPARGF